MKYNELYTPEYLEKSAKALFDEERAITRLDGWFIIRELAMKFEAENPDMPNALKKAGSLKTACMHMPIYISDNAVFAGTQRDAFARSYALINPNFKVSTFNGYCDPTAVFNDIEPNEEFPSGRIEKVRAAAADTDYVKMLSKVYADAENDTAEVAYFIEQVTGHLIPDMRPALRHGAKKLIEDIEIKLSTENDADKIIQYEAMKTALEGLLLLANRYHRIALEKAENSKGNRKAQWLLMADTLDKVPARGAETLYEAIQSFILLWQVMCMEQAPNPFAFSVGNADRIFEPYRAGDNLSRDMSAGLLKHFLVFFNVADRSWAISQNLMISGKDINGNDLTNPTSYALLDAYYAMNLPQPILSVKLHNNTPQELYEELGRFFFTPGCLTPSLFNDDSIFPLLEKAGIDSGDLADYSVAGCQEPLIMGKDNGNTTNSWLNLAKILELTINDGKSLLTGRKIGPEYKQLGTRELSDTLENLRPMLYRNIEYFAKKMADAANGASRALATLPVPFLSCLMGGIESGIDVRDPEQQGTKYNGSGCLIHGLAVVADSLTAVDALLKARPQACGTLLKALENDFKGYEELHEFLLAQDKFGNNIAGVDVEAAEIASRVSDIVHSQQNYLGNRFRADWSSPTTHMLYGYWVGATPDGRHAREMLGYGVDPLFGEATNGLGFRMLSAFKLPYEKFDGGYASHLGLDPQYFTGLSYAERGIEFKNKIVRSLFFSDTGKLAPFYLYVNVTTPEILRKVLAEPKKYAPSGVYIMRIHGTFVNFLDLSPDVQQDIIKRLDLKSTAC